MVRNEHEEADGDQPECRRSGSRRRPAPRTSLRNAPATTTDDITSIVESNPKPTKRDRTTDSTNACSDGDDRLDHVPGDRGRDLGDEADRRAGRERNRTNALSSAAGRVFSASGSGSTTFRLWRPEHTVPWSPTAASADGYSVSVRRVEHPCRGVPEVSGDLLPTPVRRDHERCGVPELVRRDLGNPAAAADALPSRWCAACRRTVPARDGNSDRHPIAVAAGLCSDWRTLCRPRVPLLRALIVRFRYELDVFGISTRTARFPSIRTVADDGQTMLGSTSSHSTRTAHRVEDR